MIGLVKRQFPGTRARLNKLFALEILRNFQFVAQRSGYLIKFVSVQPIGRWGSLRFSLEYEFTSGLTGQLSVREGEDYFSRFSEVLEVTL